MDKTSKCSKQQDNWIKATTVVSEVEDFADPPSHISIQLGLCGSSKVWFYYLSSKRNTVSTLVPQGVFSQRTFTRDLTVLDTALGQVQCLLQATRGFLEFQDWATFFPTDPGKLPGLTHWLTS